MPKKLIWQFSRKYIAGEDLDSAVKKGQMLINNGLRLTLDILGEEFTTEALAINHCNEYIKSITTAFKHKIPATFSLKPTMFGLKYDIDFCYGLIHKILEVAKRNSCMIRLDMEDSTCTDATIQLFKRLHEKYPDNVGIALQAYLYRTYDDVLLLGQMNTVNLKVNVRICKGIYIEPQEICIQNRQNIRSNFVKLIKLLFEKGFYTAIATHDIYIIEKSLELIKQDNISDNNYEFQMLYGVRPDIRNTLLKKGLPIRIYLPYGKEWFQYSTRRLRENPSLVGHIIKSIVFMR